MPPRNPNEPRPGAEHLLGQILPIYKPTGPTSHDIINALRRITGVRRVGHAGTLDPFAHGILIVGIGRPATRRLAEFSACQKEYRALALLGHTSSTEDTTGQLTPYPNATPPSLDQIQHAALAFLGPIQQRPPAFSAVKVHGRPAYKYARNGNPLDLGLRSVDILELEILRYEWPHLEFRTLVSSGTYIRSLARDLGEALHSGACLEALERTRTGPFSSHNAITLDQLRQSVDPSTPHP